MKKLELVVRKFLQSRSYLHKTLLLALSGGPDSMALFYILLKLRVNFEVAHVDHGWRTTSGEEAAHLAQICKERDIPFHTTKLTINPKETNLEELCRQERLRFFQILSQKHHLPLLLLAHHADDQAETVLKRVLEGASLAKLSALLPEKKIGSLTLLRPLLSVDKASLLAWLTSHQITYFIDQTNQDERFLRARMRTSLLPSLVKNFGKNVQRGLCHLGERAFAFEGFLQEMLNPLLADIKEVDGKVQLFFPNHILSSSFLLEEGVKRFFDHFALSLNRSHLKFYVESIQKRKKIRVEKHKGHRIEVSLGQITLFLLLDKERSAMIPPENEEL